MRSSTATASPLPRPPEPSAPRRLVLRADGGGRVGAGHVGRCVALAEAWVRAGGDAVLALTPAAAVHAEAMATSIPIEVLDVDPGSGADAEATAALSEDDWLVVDGYRFGTDLRPSGDHVVHIADRGHGPGGTAAIVLDQNLGARADDYLPEVPGRAVLLGPHYALLRSGPVVANAVEATPRRAVVALGGAPEPGVVAHLDHAIEALVVAGLEVDVLGGDGPGPAPAARPGVTVHGFVADPDAVLVRADLAVSPAGSTVYALCARGIPAVVVAFHDNQEAIAEALAAAGAALSSPPDDPEATGTLLGKLVGDRELRVALATSAARLVDGRGAERVVTELRRRDP